MRNIGDFQPLHRKPSYSDKEVKMLLHFVDRNLLDQTEPLTVYRVAVNNAFMNKSTGPAADSLRKTFIAFNKGNVHRNTPEWDDMIDLGDDRNRPLYISTTNNEDRIFNE